MVYFIAYFFLLIIASPAFQCCNLILGCAPCLCSCGTSTVHAKTLLWGGIPFWKLLNGVFKKKIKNKLKIYSLSTILCCQVKGEEAPLESCIQIFHSFSQHWESLWFHRWMTWNVPAFKENLWNIRNEWCLEDILMGKEEIAVWLLALVLLKQGSTITRKAASPESRWVKEEIALLLCWILLWRKE